MTRDNKLRIFARDLMSGFILKHKERQTFYVFCYRVTPSRQTLAQGGSVELQCVVTGEERDVSTVTYTWEKVRDQVDPATASVSGPSLTISPLAVTDRKGQLDRGRNVFRHLCIHLKLLYEFDQFSPSFYFSMVTGACTCVQ